MTSDKTIIVKNSIYYHPKEPNKTSLGCYLEYLRDKRKLGKETDEKYNLECAIFNYLNSKDE